MNTNNAPSRASKKRLRISDNSNSNSNTNTNTRKKRPVPLPPLAYGSMIQTFALPPAPIPSPVPVPVPSVPAPYVPIPVPVPSAPIPVPAPVPVPSAPVPVPASQPAQSVNRPLARPAPVDLTKKVDWTWDYEKDGFKPAEVELFCRKVHTKLSSEPFSSTFPDTFLKVKYVMTKLNQFDPFRAPTGQTLEREHVQGEFKYETIKKSFEQQEGRAWNKIAVSEGLIRPGSGYDLVCINRYGGMELTTKLSSDVLAHINQLSGAIPFEAFLELLLIQRKSRFLWCFAKMALKKVGVGIFSASTINPNNIRDDIQTRKAERYWEAEMTYYTDLCMNARSGLNFMKDDMDTIETVLEEAFALAAAGNATFRCLRYFSANKLKKDIPAASVVRSLVQQLHSIDRSEALTSMFIKDASIENVQLLADSFFCAHSTQQYGTLMESLGYSMMDTLYDLATRKGDQSQDYMKFLFKLTSISKKDAKTVMIRMIVIMNKIGKGTRAQLPHILMGTVGTDTRLLYAMFELAVYAGCDKIVFFIENIKPQIGKLVTSLAVAVNDRSHPVSEYLLGEASTNSEAEVPKSGRSPIRNAHGKSFRKVSMKFRTRGRPRVDRVLACELSHRKHLLFLENVMTLLKKGTYVTHGTNVELYNFFANISGMTWGMRFNQLKTIKIVYLALNLYPIFSKLEEDEAAVNKTMTLCEGILGKNRFDTITKEEYDALRYTVGPDPQTMIEVHYMPFTREEFEGTFSTTEFANDLKRIGQKLGISVVDFFYPVKPEAKPAEPMPEPMPEDLFVNATGEFDFGQA